MRKRRCVYDGVTLLYSRKLTGHCKPAVMEKIKIKMAQSVFSLFTLRSLYLYHFAVLPLFPSCVHLKYLVLFPFCKREAVECSRCWLCPIHSPSAPKSPPGAHVLFASEALLSSLVTSGPALVFWPDRALGGGGLFCFSWFLGQLKMRRFPPISPALKAARFLTPGLSRITEDQ